MTQSTLLCCWCDKPAQWYVHYAHTDHPACAQHTKEKISEPIGCAILKPVPGFKSLGFDTKTGNEVTP